MNLLQHLRPPTGQAVRVAVSVGAARDAPTLQLVGLRVQHFSLLQLGLLTSGLRAFVLPGSGSEAEQGTGLQEDIAAIFLGETLGARLGAGAGYSGAAEAGLGAEAEVVQQILRGTAALANTADSGPSLGSSSLTQATVETDTRHENCADYTEGDLLLLNYT